MRCTFSALAVLAVLLAGVAGAAPRFPGEHWPEASPEAVGLDGALLEQAADYLGGRGCVVRHGQMVFTWGDAAGRGDVASAAKPWYTTLLWLAVEEGLLKSVDTAVAEYVPELNGLNADLGHKDRAMTFAHMGNQVSCYGVSEPPGTAYDYNDYQMALFIDTLFQKVYGATWETLDRDVLHGRLTDILQCEDNPTFLAFGTQDRPGRLGVSPRDFARLGWLYLNEGNWNGTQLLPAEVARRAVGSPLPNRIPRTSAVEAQMLEGQRTLGSWDVPDDQTDHYGGYSWAWWVNGVDREGNRFWPDAPLNVFTALGHANGQRGMAAIPSLDMVIAWNDTTLGNRPGMPHPLNEVFRLVVAAAADGPMVGQVVEDPENAAWLARKTADGAAPMVLCGPGDPEGFLYRGARREDGTREGDQAAIIGKMRGTGANALYFQAVRSHGGDGDATHNPFVDSDPAKGLDEDILQQWEGWLRAMDDAGIVAYFFVYDDSARIWDTGDAVEDAERAFLTTLVNRFEHHRNLVWCVAEEYQERYSPARVKAIAAVIREADEHDHVIAVHKLDGLDFSEFADGPNIGQFAVQYNEPDPDRIHAGMAKCFNDAAGRYSVNLSEAADHGFGREARRKNWAAVLAGASAMPIDWTFDDEAAPSRADLEGCGILVRFFEDFARRGMAPHADLAAEGTACVLAEPGAAYLAYGADAGVPLGLRGLPAGQYAVTWCDPATGARVEAAARAMSGDVTLEAPESFTEDAAVALRRVGDAAPSATDLGRRETTMWSPFVEWRLENATYEGNPFDLEATATFTHADTGATRTTELFYAGGNGWAFRFTGTRAGDWTFVTASADPELDGFTGSVAVAPNPDPKAKGFLTHVGNRFAIMGRDETDLRGHFFQVYMNNHIFHSGIEAFADAGLVDRLLDDAQANGFDTIFAFICHEWLKLGALRWDEHDSENPDLESFAILENLVLRAHARGMRCHFWAWGDEARRWTPHGLPGGINGPVDRRVQRYIAARLGPIPGWTLGYGFDLVEWTSAEGRNGWAKYLHEKMGWDHMLCTRGFPLEGSDNNMVAYSGFGGNQDLSTTRGGPADFAEVAEDLDSHPDAPSFYEERHSHLRDGFKLDMDGTRRLRWWQAMAGGLGGFFGFYEKSPHPYPNPEQLRTVQRFWEGRMRLDLERAPDLTDGLCLKAHDNSFYVFYREDADTIRADLTGAAGPMRAVAVDAKAEYAEIDLGVLEPGMQTFQLPHVSDWAVAVGNAAPAERHPLVRNGWLNHDGRMVWGWVQHNGWWRPGQRANLARRSVGDPQGDVRPNRTEDLDLLTDNMLRYAYPGFEHNYGLWYDRRRDAHDTAHREDANVVPPFLEQPWARSEEGRAADGLPKYDLTRFNPWYFDRLAEFASLCDRKGTVLFHKFHMQHNLLETPAHYVDFPWRPFNCVQDTGLPDGLPAANAFYDMSNPVRADLQRRYIRHCLDTLGDYRNVVHLAAEEYTGPLPFVQFWMDTIAEWEAETGKDVCVGLGAPKDVQDAILADPVRGPMVDVIDLRYWWRRADGSVYAPDGGQEIAGRNFESGYKAGEETSPEQVYVKVRAYRDRYPDKALLDAVDAGREVTWAFFMAGGSLLVRGQIQYENQADPPTYEKPADMDLILPSYRFINTHLAEKLLDMRPLDILAPGGDTAWCLANPGRTYLVYAPAGGSFELRLDDAPGTYSARWFDPETGEVSPAADKPVPGGGGRRFTCPGQGDRALLLDRLPA